MLEWVAISSSRDLPDPGIKLISHMCPALAGGFFTRLGSPTACQVVFIYSSSDAHCCLLRWSLCAFILNRLENSASREVK